MVSFSSPLLHSFTLPFSSPHFSLTPYTSTSPSSVLLPLYLNKHVYHSLLLLIFYLIPATSPPLFPNLLPFYRILFFFPRVIVVSLHTFLPFLYSLSILHYIFPSFKLITVLWKRHDVISTGFSYCLCFQLSPPSNFADSFSFPWPLSFFPLNLSFLFLVLFLLGPHQWRSLLRKKIFREFSSRFFPSGTGVKGKRRILISLSGGSRSRDKGRLGCFY